VLLLQKRLQKLKPLVVDLASIQLEHCEVRYADKLQETHRLMDVAAAEIGAAEVDAAEASIALDLAPELVN